MASQGALKALIEALEAEQARRQKARFGGHADPREWLVTEMRQIAERLMSTAPLGVPLDISDMSIIEKLSCRYFLPEDLCPSGLGTEDEIWAAFQARLGG